MNRSPSNTLCSSSVLIAIVASALPATVHAQAFPSQSIRMVVAFPAGADPLGSPVGVGTLRIYENTYW
jgi:hypothetical protein